MKCKNCAAPLKANSLTCPYCGVRAEIDLKAVAYTNISHTSEVICPRCHDHLEVISVTMDQTLEIERCKTCHGLFFNPGELEYIMEHSVDNESLDRQHLNLLAKESTIGMIKNSYLKCPICREFMPFINYGSKSGVIVDWCKNHGIWLDGGEFHKLLEWKKAGGTILEESKQSEIRRQDIRRQEALKEAIFPTDATENRRFKGNKDWNELHIIDVLFRVIAWFK